MFYQVTLRFKGETHHIETAKCTEYEIKNWVKKAKKIWIDTGKPVLAEFKPAEKIFEFGPEIEGLETLKNFKELEKLERKIKGYIPQVIDARNFSGG